MQLTTEESTQYRQALNDSGVGYAVLLADGKIIEANEAFGRLYSGHAVDHVEGKRLSDLLPRAAAEERIGAVRTALDRGEPVILHELWQGVRLVVVIRPLEGGEYPHNAVFYLVRHAESIPGGNPDPSAPVIAARQTDLGPLVQLSRRELEVLAYIGEGLTNHEIAKRIFRSDKTVEWHRSQLGAKLNAPTRVDLARIAHRAGLSDWLKEQPAPLPRPAHAKDEPDVCVN